MKENERLRSELIRMRETGGGAKKITGHPLRTARERYAQVKAMKGEHPIRMLCELLKVSHSGYYRWCQQRPSARQREDAAIARRSRRHTERAGAPMERRVSSWTCRRAGRGRANAAAPV
jgi:hypothetical protein